MNRIIAAGILLLLIQGHVQSQHPIQGVVLKKTENFMPGDTLDILGYRNKLGRESYLVKSPYVDKYIPANRIRLLEENMGYWQKAWLYLLWQAA